MGGCIKSNSIILICFISDFCGLEDLVGVENRWKYSLLIPFLGKDIYSVMSYAS